MDLTFGEILRKTTTWFVHFNYRRFYDEIHIKCKRNVRF